MGGSKSGGAGSQTYDYYGTLAGAVCIGPVDELVAILLNSEEVWPKGVAWRIGLACVPGTLYVFDAQTWTCTTPHVASNTNAPGSGLEGWTEYTFKYHGAPYDDFSITASDGTHQGALRFYWGTPAQTVDAYLTAAANDGGVKGNIGNGDTHPDYRGVCYIILIDFLFGQEVQSGPNVEVVVRRAPNQSLITGSAATIVDGQANIAAALAEILTDDNMLGLPSTIIDTATWQATANFLDTYSANYGASILLDSSESLRSVLDKLIQMFDGFIRFNPSTGLIELGVYQHGVAPGGYMTVLTVTMDMLTKHPQFSTTSWQGTYSRATVRYNSRQLNYQQTSVQADDPRAFFILGVARDQALDRPFIAREGQALFHGRETLRVIGHAQMKGTLEVRREFGRQVRAGDFVFVDVDLEPNGASVFQYFRVTNRRIGPTGPITLELFADNTLSAVPFSTPYPTTPPGDAVISPLTSLRIVQMPDALSGEHNAITVLAVRPDNLTAGAQLFFDTARVLSVALVSLVADSTGTIGIATFASSPGFTIGDFLDVGGVTNGDPFNVSQAAVTYATGSVVKYALNGTVAANLAATGTIVVADYFTTFSNIGNIPNFAAKATLHTALTATAGTLDVNVDTTQADLDYFSYQYTANDAADDTLLAIIVSLVSSGTDAGQIAEAGGYGIVEICSVSTQTLVSAGRYSLTVLRGRQGTTPTAFTTANTEVWLIPRAMLAYFVNGAFDQVRANRLLNTVPQYGQFRLCPFTFAGVYPLSEAANVQFRFPLKSAGVPTLTLTSPSSTTLSYSNPAYPVRIHVTGTWTDSDSNLVEVQVLARLSTETSDRVIEDNQFSNRGSFAFDAYVQIDAPGSWTIKLLGRDSTNIVTEQDILVTCTGGAARCALPQLFDCNGNEVVNAGGDFNQSTDKYCWTNLMGFNSGNPNIPGFWATPRQFFPFGPMTFKCSTPGATISFYSNGPWLYAGALRTTGAGGVVLQTYAAANTAPFHILVNPGSVSMITNLGSATVSLPQRASYGIIAKASAPGYADSYVVVWTLPLFI
ncbi:MAG: hypothetical protein KGH75_06850 [Rhodospirillales bacterium]|nr:hypothetical protein [Rhodospirillales bacterium]